MCSSIISILILKDIEYDVPKAKIHLRNLKKEELKDLFQELGLFDSTVQNNFSHSSRDAYADDLIRTWIIEKDGVLTSEEYRGGATWENLRKALKTFNHHGIARRII